MNIPILAAAALGLSILAGCADMAAPRGAPELMLVGNDEKQSWDDAGKPVIGAPGKDTLSIVDIGTDPLAPKIVATCRCPTPSSARRSISRSRPTRAWRWWPTR